MADKYYLDLAGLQQYDGLIKTHITAKVDEEKTRAMAAEGTLSSLKTTSKGNLVSAVNEIFDSLGSDATVSVVASTTGLGTDVLKKYDIYQGDKSDPSNIVGTIDIPKDLVVTAGEVVKLGAGAVSGLDAGTYLKLTIANQANPVYINTQDLVEDFTVQASATQVQLAVSATRELSAAVVAGSIGETELGTGAVSTAKLAASAVTNAKLAENAVATTNIVDAAVTTDKLANSAVTTAKIAASAVTTAAIASKNVTTDKLDDNAVTTDKIADNNVTHAKLALNAVEAGNIKDGSVTEAKIFDGAVTADKIGDGAVVSGKLGAKAVATGNIADGAVTVAQIADATISRAKIDSTFEGQIAALETGLTSIKPVDSTSISGLFTTTPVGP